MSSHTPIRRISGSSSREVPPAARYSVTPCAFIARIAGVASAYAQSMYRITYAWLARTVASMSDGVGTPTASNIPRSQRSFCFGNQSVGGSMPLARICLPVRHDPSEDDRVRRGPCLGPAAEPGREVLAEQPPPFRGAALVVVEDTTVV
jgi:hypothetical protein